MNHFIVCLNAVAPIFIMLLIGFAARKCGIIPPELIPKINKIAFSIFLPVLVFNSVVNSDLSSAVDGKLLLYGAAATLLSYVLSLVIVLRAEKSPEKRGVLIQAMFRSNLVIIGLPLAASITGSSDLGPVAMTIAVIVPIYNVLAVITLSVFNNQKVNILKVLKSIATNPLILGTLSGLLVLLTGIRIPALLSSVIGDLAAVTTPLMLVLLGAFFTFGSISTHRKRIALAVSIRLIVIPAIFLSGAYLLGIRGVGFAGLVSAFGSPTAIASFTMAQQMGGDSELAGNCVVMSSALCPFTLFLWCFLYKSLGVF